VENSITVSCEWYRTRFQLSRQGVRSGSMQTCCCTTVVHEQVCLAAGSTMHWPAIPVDKGKEEDTRHNQQDVMQVLHSTNYQCHYLRSLPIWQLR